MDDPGSCWCSSCDIAVSSKMAAYHVEHLYNLIAATLTSTGMSFSGHIMYNNSGAAIVHDSISLDTSVGHVLSTGGPMRLALRQAHIFSIHRVNRRLQPLLQSWLVSFYLDCPIGMNLQCPTQEEVEVGYRLPPALNTN